MKVVNRKTLLSMPEGTVYSEYDGDIEESLSKLKVLEEAFSDVDWFYLDTKALSAKSCQEVMDLERRLENGEEIRVELGASARDGTFDETQKFLVLDDLDVFQYLKAQHRLPVDRNTVIQKLFPVDNLTGLSEDEHDYDYIWNKYLTT